MMISSELEITESRAVFVFKDVYMPALCRFLSAILGKMDETSEESYYRLLPGRSHASS